MCKEPENVCESLDHILCKECEWCPCVKDPHDCDTFYEDMYRNGFGGG